MNLKQSLSLTCILAIVALIVGAVGGYALAQAKDRVMAQETDRVIMAQEKAQVVQAQEKERVIQITAKRFEYKPNTITVKKGVPVL
ncbi:MAG: hypothetical protein HQK57_14175, partial [Deltaproteobacteria bacterium]|nr:hypothetical protein [Deltaproteobacteria bacterium]